MAKKKPRSLHSAVHAGDLAAVQELLEQGAKLNKLDSGDGLTPLARAVNEQHVEIVRTLLEAGAHPDRGGVEVPLASAAHVGHLGLVEMLLRAGADPNCPDEDGHGPLKSATSAAVAERLIQAGTRLDDVDEDGNNVLLGDLAYAGREEVFEVVASHLSPSVVAAYRPLLEEGVRRRKRQEDTRGTALVLAAQAGKLVAVQEMVAAGVDPDTPIAADGDTALKRAVYFNNDDVVDYLLSVGASPNSPNDGKVTPFHEALYRSSPRIVACLIEHGADVNSRNIDSKTPLELAVYYGRGDLIDLLINAGADTSGKSAEELRSAAAENSR